MKRSPSNSVRLSVEPLESRELPSLTLGQFRFPAYRPPIVRVSLIPMPPGPYSSPVSVSDLYRLGLLDPRVQS